VINNWQYNNFNILHYDEVASTNELLIDLAKSRLVDDFTVIIANSQNSGKGQFARKWHSPLGNLYFSLLIRHQPHNQYFTAPNINQIGNVAVVAIYEAISKIAKEQLENCDNQLIKDSLSNLLSNMRIKFPNDLLINKEKVAGMLLASEIRSSVVDFVVIGMGVNITNHPPQYLLDNLPANNLYQYGIKIDNIGLLLKFLTEFMYFYQIWQKFGIKQISQIWDKLLMPLPIYNAS
jgi:BirA family biotin operon repressor/biotin-[acetyl-CoA-carboxylase] ligase